jgi:ADP-heptose:LPS heptosyltransferase
MKEISWQRRIFSFFLSLIAIVKNNKTLEISSVNNILVSCWAYLGDIITATPAIRFLRTCFPEANITLLTSPENKEYISDFPYVDNIIFQKNPLHLKKSTFFKTNIFSVLSIFHNKKYDIAIELTGRIPNQLFLFFINAKYKIGEDPTNNFPVFTKRLCSSNIQIHEIDRNIDIIKLITSGKKINKELWNPVTEDDVNFVDKFIKQEKICSPFVIIHISASWSPKVWNANKWKDVCNDILSKGRMVLFIGSLNEYYSINNFCKNINGKGYLNISGKLTIGQVVALMQKAELFVGNDSGPMHLAAVAGLKGVVIFGPGDPVKWSYPIHRVIYKQISCNPCPQIPYKKRCSKGFHSCKALEEIKSEEVIAEYDKLTDVKHI